MRALACASRRAHAERASQKASSHALADPALVNAVAIGLALPTPPSHSPPLCRPRLQPYRRPRSPSPSSPRPVATLAPPPTRSPLHSPPPSSPRASPMDSTARALAVCASVRVRAAYGEYEPRDCVSACAHSLWQATVRARQGRYGDDEPAVCASLLEGFLPAGPHQPAGGATHALRRWPLSPRRDGREGPGRAGLVKTASGGPSLASPRCQRNDGRLGRPGRTRSTSRAAKGQWAREVNEVTNQPGSARQRASAPAGTLDRRSGTVSVRPLPGVWVPNSTQPDGNISFGPRWAAGGSDLLF